MGTSTIEWTEKTWNPVRGCVKISPGCKFCYAENFAERWRGIINHPYEQGFDLRLVADKLEEPLHWSRPSTVFVNSMSDLFQDGVPFEFIEQVFAVMAQTPRHTYQVLTKRAARMRDFIIASRYCAEPLANVHLGVSVEDQKRANERLPILRHTSAAVRFISYEPALDDVNFHFLPCSCYVGMNPHPECEAQHGGAIHWLIIGGESGGHARVFDLDWARHAIGQARQAKIPVFVKQMGVFARVNGHHKKFEHYAGRDPIEWPADLRVREFPR